MGFLPNLHSNRGDRGYKELTSDRLVVNMSEKKVDEGGKILSCYMKST